MNRYDRRAVVLISSPEEGNSPSFAVRQDIRTRFIAFLKHRGFQIANASSDQKTSSTDRASLAEIKLVAGTPIEFLASAQGAFLAQIDRSHLYKGEAW